MYCKSRDCIDKDIVATKVILSIYGWKYYCCEGCSEYLMNKIKDFRPTKFEDFVKEISAIEMTLNDIQENKYSKYYAAELF